MKIIKKVRVSGKSIRQGIPENCELCPVAIAVTKALKLTDDQFVSVNGSTIEIRQSVGGSYPSNPVATGKAPRQVQRFVRKFDRTPDWNGNKRIKRAYLEPFTFILRMDSTI